ncbi:MAG: efflux RND transporter permease subunit, partial [Planctomycetes bacterium]|nr:efflux RND transporter permease subunit [Planctomycetota bacterium]
MRLARFSLAHPVTVTVCVAAICLFGWLGVRRLPLNLLPDFSYPSLTIRTELPGAAPGEVEELITRPVEDAVGVIRGVWRQSSSSRAGVSEVTVEFNWGTAMDFAVQDVQEKLDNVNFPREAVAPAVLRYDPAEEPILRYSLAGGGSLMQLRQLADKEIKDGLQAGVEGVAAVRVEGGYEEEIQVLLSESAAAARRLSPDQVIRRLAEANVDLTGGVLKEGAVEYQVITKAAFRTVEEIGRINLGSVGDAAVHLDDVAVVRRGAKDRKVITRLNGHESVEISVFKAAEKNTVAVAEEVEKKAEEVRGLVAGRLPGASFVLVYDGARFIRQAVGEVTGAATIGGLLAVAILYLFLKRVRSTVAIAFTIPISVMATFFLMYVTKVSMNIMSLGGLALGIGMLVDNSIVVIEAIDRRIAVGEPLAEAAVRGTGVVGTAITGSTLTTLCVFVPIIFVTGVAGQLFADQALTVTYSLAASLLVAVTLIPLAMAWRPREASATPAPAFPVPHAPAPSSAAAAADGVPNMPRGFILLRPALRAFDILLDSVTRGYPRAVGWALCHRGRVVLVSLLLLAVSVMYSLSLGRELIPEMSQGEFFVTVRLPNGAPLVATDGVVREMEAAIEAERARHPVERVAALVGTTASTGGVREERENLGQIQVTLGAGQVGAAEDEAVAALRARFAEIPGMEPARFSRPALFSLRTPIEVEIAGHDLARLRDYSARLTEAMAAIPGLTDIRSSAEGGSPELHVVIDREKLAAKGLAYPLVAAALRDKVAGSVATQFNRGDRKIDVRVRLREDDRREPAQLGGLIVGAGGDAPIPLAAVATITEEIGPAEIRRAGGERVAVVSTNVVGRDLAAAAADLEALVADMAPPRELAVAVGGQNREMRESFDSLIFALSLAAFFVYLVMASQFESLLQPLIIMFSIPFSVVGVAAGLAIAGQSVSVVVLIGCIILAGIVVNNAIVLLDAVNRLRAENGLPVDEALIEAGRIRLRPILMTTSTTVLGLLPLAFGSGEGAEVRRPMAVAVIGGLTSSTILTLIVVPVLYSLLLRGRTHAPTPDPRTPPPHGGDPCA